MIISKFFFFLLAKVIRRLRIKLDSFFHADCHRVVDPEQFYLDCLYDVCSCEVKLSDCLCPSVASYAKECARKHVIVDWLPELPKCGKKPPVYRRPPPRSTDTLINQSFNTSAGLHYSKVDAAQVILFILSIDGLMD